MFDWSIILIANLFLTSNIASKVAISETTSSKETFHPGKPSSEAAAGLRERILMKKAALEKKTDFSLEGSRGTSSPSEIEQPTPSFSAASKSSISQMSMAPSGASAQVISDRHVPNSLGQKGGVANVVTKEAVYERQSAKAPVSTFENSAFTDIKTSLQHPVLPENKASEVLATSTTDISATSSSQFKNSTADSISSSSSLGISSASPPIPALQKLIP